MRADVPIFLVLAAAGFHTALTSSLESAEKEATLHGVGFERLTDLQKRDQEEFEAAVKKEYVESEDDRYLEGGQAENIGKHQCAQADKEIDENIEADQLEPESDEDADGLGQKREHLEANVEEADEMSNLDEIIEDLAKEEGLGQKREHLEANVEEADEMSNLDEIIEDLAKEEGLGQKREHLEANVEEADEMSNLDEIIEDLAKEEAELLE
ncbi:hypothetical protein UPYG_G00283240 [Umbra pygmaea]|uniref:Uncharacterized protein n=1 Tax=Umbra pygmaea TaxID=75934 RepID=A0ABD0W845_UMBPY